MGSPDNVLEARLLAEGRKEGRCNKVCIVWDGAVVRVHALLMSHLVDLQRMEMGDVWEIEGRKE